MLAIVTCLSVCLSVTSRYCVKTNMISSPSGSPMILAFDAKFYPDILRGLPERVPQTREGWVKSAVFIFKREYLENGSR